MSGRNQNLKYFFLNLEKEWKMLSWLTQTISSKNILSQRRKAIYPAPKSPSPPWPVLKSSQEGWAATNKKNSDSDVWKRAELSAAAQCTHHHHHHHHHLLQCTDFLPDRSAIRQMSRARPVSPGGNIRLFRVLSNSSPGLLYVIILKL